MDITRNAKGSPLSMSSTTPVGKTEAELSSGKDKSGKNNHLTAQGGAKTKRKTN
jgi:hypothetical protein